MIHPQKRRKTCRKRHTYTHTDHTIIVSLRIKLDITVSTQGCKAYIKYIFIIHSSYTVHNILYNMQCYVELTVQLVVMK